MTQTANTPLTDVHDMVVVHRAFRREFRLIPELVRAVPAGDTARAAVLAGHARMVLTGLHLHHTGEDVLLWPKLLERCTPDAALVHRMEAQHERVDAAIQKLGPALTRWEAEARPAVTEEVGAGFDELRTALLEHLDDEEREILPLAARHITQAEWNQLGEHGQKEMRMKDLPILFGAVFEEATPEERAEMLGVVPAPVRFLLRTVFARRYERYIRRVREGR
ncbi:hemerythrin domain-containing protein [Blastococcus sp. CT_GayMR19]|uniref:hemerythrin domain-containing protein n=1 Tax=Blastococcus sp. CT_GayMR19 TaxID=2559608 RepID=UPI0010737609|nr:hemerythrin domain-containing protein [Blastococcus sp. CT_GayMR19]TFV74421.1 hemerythrin domain-containing protein [Blastococcus sp. CT_GayMR19]